jgi:hypothetical protein
VKAWRSLEWFETEDPRLTAREARLAGMAADPSPEYDRIGRRKVRERKSRLRQRQPSGLKG